MFDYKQLFDLKYWLTADPGPLSTGTALLFASFFVLMIILKFCGKALYSRNKNEILKPQRRLLWKAESFLLTMGSLGVMWTFFAYQMVPILSARFWLLLWILAALIWLYFIGYFALDEMPQQLKEISRKKEREKYMPRKK